MLALRPVALKIGLIDAPGGRKLHSGDIPITGGIAMFVGVFVSVSILPVPGSVLASILIASSILLAVGVLDDIFGLSAYARLASQIVVVLLMFFGAGLSLADIGDPFGTGIISMGSFSLIFTTLVFVTMINAYNFVDGADGLAGSLSLIGLLAITVVSGLHNIWGAVAFSVAASTVGFLLFNFPTALNRPFRAFMGDGGSTLLGFTFAWVTLGICQGPERLISPVYCLWFAAIPIFDFMTCFFRRIRKGRSPFVPGRDHFHHVLERGRHGVRWALGILTGLQLVYVIVALLCYFARVPDVVMFAAWSALGLSQRFIILQISKYQRLARIKSIRRKRAPQLRQA